MISYNFEYYQPQSLGEAVDLFEKLDAEHKSPLYYSGGTEIITMGRMNLVFTRAVIDIKHIPECRALTVSEDRITVGSAVTLSELYDSGAFPLLGETGAGVADRTSRNKITVGGNICGRFIYKEAVLPLLLTDSEVLIAGPDGLKQVPILECFNRTLQLSKGELLVQMLIDSAYRGMPFLTVKKRQVSSIDYPLVTIAALRTESGIRAAFSGVADFPFRSIPIETIINRRSLTIENRVNQAVENLPAPILSDIRGSAAYRELVLKNTLSDIISSLGGE